MQIHEYLELDVDREVISCRKCREDLCDASENYKEHAAMRRLNVEDVSPGWESPAELLGTDPRLEMRQFFCPSCGILFGQQIAHEDDPILHDIEIDLDSLSS